MPFHIPHAPSLVHIEPRMDPIVLASLGISHACTSELELILGGCPLRLDRPRVGTGLPGGLIPLAENKGGSSDSESSYVSI
jgi:hypothetical protein